jgi:hypothetical protein
MLPWAAPVRCFLLPAALIPRFEEVSMRLLRLLAVVALVLTGARLNAASPVAAKDEIPTDAVRVELIPVIDGFAVDVGFDLSRRDDPDRIRMIGVDAPQTTYSYGNHRECYGEEASKKTDSLLVAASEIWVEVEPWYLLCVAGHLSKAHACGLVDPRAASEVAWMAGKGNLALAG